MAQVDMVAHSAGGWLARAYLGDPTYPGAACLHPPSYPAAAYPNHHGPTARLDDTSVYHAPTHLNYTAASQQYSPSYPAASSTRWDPTWRRGADKAPTGKEPPAGATVNRRVKSLITLGTPHRAPPPEKVRDMTGGSHSWVDRNYPGMAPPLSCVALTSVGHSWVDHNCPAGYVLAFARARGWTKTTLFAPAAELLALTLAGHSWVDCEQSLEGASLPSQAGRRVRALMAGLPECLLTPPPQPLHGGTCQAVAMCSCAHLCCALTHHIGARQGLSSGTMA
jgi:hypothetical protein